MTRKEKIMRLVERQQDNVSYEKVIDRLVFLRKIEIALEQADRGEGTEHDELFRRLEKEWKDQESKSAGQKKLKKDLRKVHDYIAQDAPRRAAAFAKRIRDAVGDLRKFPALGEIAEDADDPEIRQLLVGSYRVLYRLRPPMVRILTVLRGDRLLRPEDLPK